MVRGLPPVILFWYDTLKINNDIITSIAIVGTIVFTIAIHTTLTIPETHNIDLDFTE